MTSSNKSIYSMDDYIITPASKFYLLTLKGKNIYIENEGICKVKSFDVCKVAKSCGICLFGRYKTITVLSKVVLECIDTNETKYFDRNSSNLKSIITKEIRTWLVNPNIQPIISPLMAS